MIHIQPNDFSLLGHSDQARKKSQINEEEEPFGNSGRWASLGLGNLPREGAAEDRSTYVEPLAERMGERDEGGAARGRGKGVVRGSISFGDCC